MNSRGQSGPIEQTVRRFRRNVPGVVGLIMVAAVVLLCYGAPLVAELDPLSMDTSAILETPSLEHPFGTDQVGRDAFSRAVRGGRTSILVGVLVTAVTTVVGVGLGLVAAYYRRVDDVLMRFLDIVMAFPTVLLALAIVAILRPQLTNVVIALVIPYTPRLARVVRGEVLQLKEMDFVMATRALGARDLRIIARHLLPNAFPIVIVRQTYIMATAILAEAALTFLGVGVPPETPTLGGIISEARSHLRYAPWLPLYPGVIISTLVLGFNLLGDGLRDVLDPRMKGRG